MFKYTQLNENEIQISDYPFAMTIVASIIFIICFYASIFVYSNIIASIFILLTFAVFVLRFTKKSTNINFKTHKASISHQNIIYKKHYMLELADLKIIQTIKKSTLNKRNVIAFTDGNKIYPIIDFDIVEKDKQLDAMNNLKKYFKEEIKK